MTFPEPDTTPDSTPESTPDNDVLGRRIGAALVDAVVLSVVFVLFSVLFGGAAAEDGQVSANLTGLPFLVFLAVSFLYYFVQEVAGGQTLGKRLLGVRVVQEDGSPAAAGPVAGRTALRVVDGFFFYLVGLIVVLATGKKRARVGDLAAGTRVVRA